MSRSNLEALKHQGERKFRAMLRGVGAGYYLLISSMVALVVGAVVWMREPA